MRLRIHICLLFLLLASTLLAQVRFRPGDVVPKPYLKVYGYESFFWISPISDELKDKMDGNSYKSGSGMTWDQLRYLQVLHCDWDGNDIVGEMVCNTAVAEDLLQIFKALYLASYPIEKMRLVEDYGGDDDASMRDNNTSCFNQRRSTAGGMVSKHSFGLAVDINPKYNPYYKIKESGKTIVKPEDSEDYLDRNESFPYKIEKGDLCYRLFRQHGFYWGGDWASGKDYQHFERSQTSNRYE